MPEGRVILQTVGLTHNFGGLRAVDAVDLQVREGHVHCIIGPNGAGKSTLFNLISGMLAVRTGTITFDGRPIAGKPPHEISRLGLVRSFQTPRVFASLSVLDHVLLADDDLAQLVTEAAVDVAKFIDGGNVIGRKEGGGCGGRFHVFVRCGKREICEVGREPR